MTERINKIRAALKAKRLSAMFITDLADIRYISGFTGSAAYILITKENVLFFTDGRYAIQSENEVSPDIKRIILKRYKDVFKGNWGKYGKILVQAECSVAIASLLKSAGAKIVEDKKDTIKTMRMIKNDAEIKLIKEQYALAAEAFLKSLEEFKIGRSEREWAAALEYNVKTCGADDVSFETIVASGFRGAMPHGRASSKKIEAAEPVIIDFGSKCGYNSDYTRMVYGGNDKEVLHVINIVREAVLRSIEAVKPGRFCKDIDAIARKHISSCGFGRYFTHSLGHGVGLDVHELPVLNKFSKTRIEEGMIFTIEPGIYLPNRFGVRLEDTVLVTANGAEVISSGLEKYVYAPNGV